MSQSSTLDLIKLEAERERASRDKADLFDFYHANWDRLISEITKLPRYPSDPASPYFKGGQP